MQIPSNFTISPASQKGEVYGTEFTFTADLPSRFTKFAWDFGDRSSLVYNNNSAKHIYQYPGIYTVNLSSWSNYGEIYTDFATIDVDYVLRDAILFKRVPNTYGVPGRASTTPFTVSITSAKIDQPISIVFQSFNSRSVPYYSIPDKWKFITPNWRFLDENKEIIQGQAVINTTPIYNSENRVIAVKGEKDFYYVDDLSTGLNPETDCPLIIITTLSTERFSYPPESIVYPYASYSNSEISRAVVSWQVNDVISSHLKVTENFISDVYPIKWAGVPIPVMINPICDTSRIQSYANSEKYTTTVLSYPRTNEIGSKNSVNLRLSSDTYELIKGVHYKLEKDDLYFRATDEIGNVASGYIFTSLTPLSSYPGNNVIVADTITINQPETKTAFAFPIGYPIQPFVYISHPAKHTINKLDIAIAPRGCPELDEFRRLNILVEGSFEFIKTAAATETNLVNYYLSGYGETCAMSFNASRNRLYTADVGLNTVSCYIEGSTLLTSVNLEHIFNRTSLGPSYISVDSQDNLWVSLLDDQSLVKLDPNLNFLLSAEATEFARIILEPLETPNNYLLNEDETFLLFSSEDDIVKLHPPIVETDRNDDIWVCYPDVTVSRLFKLNSVGETLIQAELPTNSFPVSLSITSNNEVWVACKNTSSVLLFSTDGYLLSSITGLLYPSYIANDLVGGVCILHGYNLYSYYDIETKQLKTWRMSSTYKKEGFEDGSADLITSYTAEDIKNAREKDEIWGGLCTDVYNRVWAIDSVENKAFIFKVDTTSRKIVNILPANDYKYYVWKAGDTFQTELTAEKLRSAQAAGDWTGNRWYQKYASGYKAQSVVGVSAPFKIYDLDNSFKITKVNETFNCAEYFKQLALPEILQNNPVLFDEFFAAVVGNGDPAKEDAGRVIYERIANFVSNRGDFETAEIDALTSLAKQMAVDVPIFGVDFPVAVNRLLNLFSVHKHNLRGIPNIETDISKKMGRVLTETDKITADQLYLFKDKKFDSTKIVYATPNGIDTVYPLSEFKQEGLRNPLAEHYHIFLYNDQLINEDRPYIGNLIDWNKDFTTLSYNVSSHEEWYGDGGIVETMFNNLLTKQLFRQ